MPNQKIKGNLIGITLNGKFISCETRSDFSFECDMRVASAIKSGRWREVIPGVRSWQMAFDANLLLGSITGAGINDVLNAFIDGTLLAVSFRTRDSVTPDFTITGEAYIQSGGIEASVGIDSTYNAVLIGTAPFSATGGDIPPVVGQLQFGFQSVDPYGNELLLNPQFSKTYIDGSTEISFNFTAASAGNYLYMIVPTGSPKFNTWENSTLNFGTLPDYAWRDPYTIGDKDYYVSREPLYITSEVPTVVLKYKSDTPTSFVFVDIANALRSTQYISNEITVAGITEPVAISITGGEYSVNGGAYTSAVGFVSAGDKVRVRLTSSADYDTTTSAALTIGTVSDSYDVTTQEDAELFYAYRSAVFIKEGCVEPEIGQSVPFTKTYTAASQPAADALAAADANFDTDGQAYANANGTCQTPFVEGWGQFTRENEETVGGNTYAHAVFRAYKGISTTVPPEPSEENNFILPLDYLSVQKTQEGVGVIQNWTMNTRSGLSVLVIAPGSELGNPVYPKQLIRLSDGTDFYFNFPGKTQDEMFYLGSFYLT